ncbi:hypothetical protein AVEN_124369-1 [Araneus ventricosus]|uniref:Uncharacterized protein n=1 Tax=Araneus ventricosus TaxID=182803 RepID=A0A4Y2KWT7_ARAVE|nr:hypothetical protein AVEN_124369-1 [Araneus ventricosus]
MKALLTENSHDAKNYRERIWEYNSALAFDSMGAQIKPPLGTGPYCYRLHGQVYHRVSPCMEINPFAQSFLQMHRLVQEHPTTAVKMVFLEDKNLDMQRYNAPSLYTEVAAVFVGDNGEPPANRDICVYPVGIHAMAFHL